MATPNPLRIPNTTTPRIILHGGAGNITPTNLPPEKWTLYKSALLSILSTCTTLLQKDPSARALDIATHAVTLFESNALFNCGHGAVFTRAGTIELEASVMVSDAAGFRKRGCGVMAVSRVKHPILLAKEMLVRGEEEDGGGAYAHVQLSGRTVEELAKGWGLEMCEPSAHFTKRRWDEHKRGLEREREGKRGGAEPRFPPGDPSWDGREYLPQGTVGAVVLDRFGTICVATSTGGLTNKLPGRIGDTPTLGAGYWAEEWMEDAPSIPAQMSYRPGEPSLPDSLNNLSRGNIKDFLGECFPYISPTHEINYAYSPTRSDSSGSGGKTPTQGIHNIAATSTSPFLARRRRAVAMSGTGNGDSFLRLSAARTAAAMSRFSTPALPLQTAVSRMAGSGGALQESAGDRWGRTGEGEGGIIGIEVCCAADGSSESGVVWDFNCGGMFRAWVDDSGRQRCMVFKDEY
ncbi:N-terminal nucleophile aminohydrolase [Aulographum hederae CBS 113979]|uniref:N-terminal nucleophile aminohydrolase n=1 Tax=Aulographum hederae CBS 113979 TaxID=1176131 RepID=A0A6G1GVU5_9PEZI|nr:N-terminal nucleophile aminohydrolase [Aulographum hederae CBS 113979]